MDINTTAAQWAARVDAGPLQAEESAELENWLAAHPQHLGAFARARAVLAHFDDQRLAASAAATVAPRGVTRRWLGASIAAATLCVAIGLSLWRIAPSEQFSSGTGEVKLVPLADGSTVSLNTRTQIDVRFTEQQRTVDLESGEALFRVAHAPERAFVVTVDGTQVKAVGTAFVVRRMAGQAIEILVIEGTVEVQYGTPRQQALLKAASSATFSPPDVLRTALLAQEAVERRLAWREGMIAFNGETLREAAQEFARYSNVNILIEDAAVASRTVTGLFAARDPIGFAEAIALSMDLHVEVYEDSVRLTP